MKKNKHYPNGFRIDYILYRAKPNESIKCRICEVVMGLMTMHASLFYSDHEAVAAEFDVKQKGTIFCASARTL